MRPSVLQEWLHVWFLPLLLIQRQSIRSASSHSWAQCSRFPLGPLRTLLRERSEQAGPQSRVVQSVRKGVCDLSLLSCKAQGSVDSPVCLRSLLAGPPLPPWNFPLLTPMKMRMKIS